MYYRPDPSAGRRIDSIRDQRRVSSNFVRGMHKWGSSVMVVLVFLHMGRPDFVVRGTKYRSELAGSSC